MCSGQQAVAEIDKEKIPMTHEEEKHAQGERDAHAHSMVVEGVRELEIAIKQVSVFAQHNHEMMSQHYQLLYWMVVLASWEHTLMHEVYSLRPAYVGGESINVHVLGNLS